MPVGRGLHAASHLRCGLEAALGGALARGELSVAYQPQFDLGRRSLTGAEALLRWSHPQFGDVSPETFIPIAERTGLIAPIGEWVLRRACEEAGRWHRAGRALRVAVNLSPRQLRQHDLVGVIAGALRDSDLPAECLELEITEGFAIASLDLAAEVLNEIHALGVKLALDDFGTGYSNASYLHRFALDRLKIDRSFVRDMASPAGREAILATVALAHGLRLEVVAEGVETEPQHALLARMGCAQGQGFLYGHAVAAASFRALIEPAAARSRSARVPGIAPVNLRLSRLGAQRRDPIMGV